MSFVHLIENSQGLSTPTDFVQWGRDNSALFKGLLAEHGALLFRGFPVESAEDFDAFSAAFDYTDFTYDESLSNAVRINLTPRVFTANEAPPDVEIFLHHEMAQTPIYPDKLFFCCLSAAEQGGATPLCRSDHLYSQFKSAHPNWAEKFAQAGLKYTTHMPDKADTRSGQGRSWKNTLSVRNKSEAERRLADLGYSWQWQADNSLLTTTPVLPAVRQLPDGSESFFNQVIAAYCGWKRKDDDKKPVLTFGTGEPIPDEMMQVLIDLSAKLAFPLNWQDGDVALVDNHRVMHGRLPYSGSRKREVVVCLARNPS